MENHKIEFYGGLKDGEVISQATLPLADVFIAEISPVLLYYSDAQSLEFHHYRLIKLDTGEYQYKYQGIKSKGSI